MEGTRSHRLRILGLDPGLRNSGWGVIDIEGSRLTWVADGVVRSDEKLGLPERLSQLHRGIAEIIETFVPAEAAIEEIFVNRNPVSTLKLGQARGAILTAAGLAGLQVGEYAPNRVKKCVVGTGHAAKPQIDLMVRRLLPGCLAVSEDAADALAVAVCHAHWRGNAAKMAMLEAAR